MLGWSGRDRNRVGVPVCKFSVVSYLLGVIAGGFNLHVAFVLYVLMPLFFITPQRAYEVNLPKNMRKEPTESVHVQG